MRICFTRRNVLTTSVATLLAGVEMRAQTPEIPIASLPVAEAPGRSTVALTSGENRRKNVFDAIDLVDFNEEGKYVRQALLDENAHPVAVRLAARLFDPEAFIIGATPPKTHNYAVISMSVKNMVLGAPLHSGFGGGPRGSISSSRITRDST